MKYWDTVAIVGVGLIGGSIGLALRQRGLARRVVGIGRNPTRLEVAVQLGAISEYSMDMATGASEAELTVVCTPVGRIASHVRQIAQSCPADALITDAGSTKGSICADLYADVQTRDVFVGSHPMAGSEKSGVEFASADLFQGRVTIVTAASDSHQSQADRIQEFWESLGSEVIRMSPDEHDAAVADVSHLPHLVASALSAGVQTDLLKLAAGGWRDTTRVAAADADLWRQILWENRRHILQSLDNFGKVLFEFRESLTAEDPQQLQQLLEAGKQNRDSLGS